MTRALGDAVDLEGVILVHRDFGYCKIITHNGNAVQVHFIGTSRDAWYGIQAIAAQKDFKWQAMPVGMKCQTSERGPCTIAEASFGTSETHGTHDYLVVFDGAAGETARLTERELWPIPDSLAETPLTRLSSLRADPMAHFRAREGLLAALSQITRESGGVRALASSRVALLSHQAFVIGTVIDDPIWRYILADEVGLGKTIEAGAITHQLLVENPNARVLILSPAPLARQWLCEMHLSFGGRSFRLLDLHQPEHVELKNWPLVISSLKSAVRHYHKQLLSLPWDIVIVDEAHQLLWNEENYEFVERLVNQSPRLLLLSAVPARERDKELMQLLHLINPHQYRVGTPAAERFSSLYAAQATIGRRLRIVIRQLQNVEDLDHDQLAEDVERLLSLDVLTADPKLRDQWQLTKEAKSPADALLNVQELVNHVVTHYRISRRILKNRRARLVDAELLPHVRRSVQLVPYEPSLLEEQIGAITLDLIQPLAGESQTNTFQVLFRKLAQSLCDPVAIWEIANTLLRDHSGASLNLQMFDANAAFDYDEHDAVLDGLANLFGPKIDEYRLKQLVSLLSNALDIPEQARITALIGCLEKLFAEGTNKVLVFAGAFGAAEYVIDKLNVRFGLPAVSSFRHDLDDDEKEKQVARFRRDQNCRILVSDESGGEGRNFQFADEIVHFDLPWSVSAVEQRVGRLDRIGRGRAVRSYIICPSYGLELAWFRCLAEGFGVFTQSISGLEYMLHGAERRAVGVAAEGGPEALIDLIPEIRNASERERASDDAEAVTDAASFHSTKRYLQSSDHSGDDMLEKFLPAYLRAISRSDAARQVTDNKDLNLRIWRFKPEDVSDYKLVGLERQGENPIDDIYGTFSRTVARERPDLNFFAVGHPLIDALAIASHEHIRGRSFQAVLATNVVTPNLVFLSAWRVRGLEKPAAMPGRALRLLESRVVWTGVDIQTGEPIEAALASQLANELRAEDSTTHDLDLEQAVEAFQPEAGQWSATLKELLLAAGDQANDVYAACYSEFDAVFCEQLYADKSALAQARVEDGAAYNHELDAITQTILNAKLALDVLGLVKLVARVAP